MKHRSLYFVFILAALFIVSGCTRSNMALKTQFNTKDKSIGLFTLRTSNIYRTSFQPAVNNIVIAGHASDTYAYFYPDKPYKEIPNQFYEYLVSIDLEPGKYRLETISGTSRMIPLVAATFVFNPIGILFNLPPKKVVYLGRVSITNRERKEGETRAGPIIPLLDQAVAGFSDGTFDISISDMSEEDIPSFIQSSPSLKYVPIDKAIMLNDAIENQSVVEKSGTAIHEITKPNIPPPTNSETSGENLYSSEITQKLRELKKLKDDGLLNNEEYEKIRKPIVDGL